MGEIKLLRADLIQDPLVRKNMAALAASGQDKAIAWLQESPALGVVTATEGVEGHQVISVGGQAQASRYDPEKEARQWLEKFLPKTGSGRLALFGLGHPELARLLVDQAKVVIFEPDPQVALAAFSYVNFEPFLTSDRLILTTPWHLADEPAFFHNLTLLVHPAAKRRAESYLTNLKKALTSRRDLSQIKQTKPRLLIIPPLSGGSWPVAVSLARAAEAGGFASLFLSWDQRFHDLENEAHRAPPRQSGQLIAKLFQETALAASQVITSFKPDAIIALAQAPLDAPAINQLRDATDAPLAFWLVEDMRNFGYVAEIAPAYDAVFHIQPGLAEPTLRNLALSNSWYLPLAADPVMFQPLPQGFQNHFAADLSFMGAGYPNRRYIVNFLAGKYWPTTGRPIDSFKIYGSGWAGVDVATRAHLFEGGRRVTLPECALIYGGGRVNLNIHSSIYTSPVFNQESLFVNPRTFEIAAAGGLQVVDQRPLLPELFEDGKEIVVANTLEDLPQLIDYFLAHPLEGEAIGKAARARVLAEHTYTHRLEKMLSCLGWP